MQSNIDTLYLIIPIIVVLLALAMVILFIVFNNRKNDLLKRKFDDEMASQKKLHNIELNALRSQMNPHFVFNSLNAIQYYIQKNEVELSENYLTKFSKLMRQFFEFSKESDVNIADEIELLKNYLDIEKLRFEDKIDYEIIVDKNLDIDNHYIPTMLLQPIVENAVNHGLFHKTGKGKVSISFLETGENSYQVIIKDNGVGINKTLEMKKGQHKRLSSSNILDERLLLLKKNNAFDIEKKITDLSDVSNLSGTEVTLDIIHNSENNT